MPQQDIVQTHTPSVGAHDPQTRRPLAERLPRDPGPQDVIENERRQHNPETGKGDQTVATLRAPADLRTHKEREQ